MNERIKELSKVAEKHANDFPEEAINKYEDVWHRVYSEKFAELIIRECADICGQQGRVGWNDDRKAQARLDGELIQKHFGVE